MPTETESMGRRVNIGNVLQIIVLIVTVCFAWAAFDRRITLVEMQVTDQRQSMQRIEQQTNRMERYMQSNDSHYWKKVRDTQ